MADDSMCTSSASKHILLHPRCRGYVAYDWSAIEEDTPSVPTVFG